MKRKILFVICMVFLFSAVAFSAVNTIITPVYNINQREINNILFLSGIDCSLIVNSASNLCILAAVAGGNTTSLPASNITAGTFGSGLYTFPSGLNITQGGLIVSAGNVGIGTTSPNYKLDVNGNINSTGLLVNSTAGFTGTCTILGLTSINVKGGIITGCS